MYLFVWFVFFGASYAAKMGAHNRVTFQFKVLPRKAVPWVEGFADLFWLGFNLYFVYLSYDFVFNKMNPFWKSQTIGVPMKYFYVMLPVAFVLMSIRDHPGELHQARQGRRRRRPGKSRGRQDDRRRARRRRESRPRDRPLIRGESRSHGIRSHHRPAPVRLLSAPADAGRADHRCAGRLRPGDLPLSGREPHQVRADRLHLGRGLSADGASGLHPGRRLDGSGGHLEAPGRIWPNRSPVR